MFKRESLSNKIKSKKTFLTHYNGGKPFKIQFNNGIISIYKYDINEGNKYEVNPVLTIKKYNGVFIGTHANNKFPGNTILVHINRNKYIYIGETIIKFETLEPIKYYISELGNSDVPYPYAVTDLYIYLLVPIQNKNKKTYYYIEKNKLIKKDPYTDFYTQIKNKNNYLTFNTVRIV